ncbi:MAG: endolytic transglycosylase MltG [Tagaea sp.]|nr:endolytic transglycosylase MltG [Tagaea sp.]
MTKRRLAALVVLAFLTIGAAAIWRVADLYVSPGPAAEPVRVVVPRGVGGEAIAELLADSGAIASSWAFLAGARWDGHLARLKAGEYAIPAQASAREVAALLASGRVFMRRVTLVEGHTSAQMLAILRGLEGAEGEIPPPAEGTLLPDTYFYTWGETRARLVERAARAQRDLLAELWPRRAPDLPLRNVEEALVLASIVERETGHADERPRVAAVFVNRLRIGMRLQADPTVAYGVDPSGPLGRPLSRADLDNRHPWNTYVHAGLPPTPIAHPGRAAIEAVLDPPKTDELFFVAAGDGRHVFARTLAEHNRNVARLREIERSRGQR